MTAAHLDYDALADLAEGILDDDAAASAERHLSGCADCRARAAEVAEVSRVLAEAPTPPMPAHLVDRLDAAIAAEAASYPPAHRHARRFQFLAAAAAAVVVAGGGAVAVRTVLADGDSDSAKVTQPPVEDHSRPSWGQNARPRPQAAPQVPFTVVRSGTKYTAARLESQVSSVLSRQPATGNHAMSEPDDTLSGCVGRVGGGRSPLLVDSATYDGRPATIVVLPGRDARHADVVVVGPKCSAADGDVISRRDIAR